MGEGAVMRGRRRSSVDGWERAKRAHFKQAPASRGSFCARAAREAAVCRATTSYCFKILPRAG